MPSNCTLTLLNGQIDILVPLQAGGFAPFDVLSQLSDVIDIFVTATLETCLARNRSVQR